MTALIQWCKPEVLDSLPCQRDAWRDWLKVLSDRVSALPAGQLDAVEADMTALGLLAMNRDTRDLAAEGAQVLLDAGANPLAGDPAVVWTPGFIDESHLARMFLDRLAASELTPTPYRSTNGGNLLHVLASDGLGWLQILALDPPDEHAAVLSTWLAQPLPGDGNTPLHVMWQVQLDRWNRDRTVYDTLISAMWNVSAIRPGWPVDLTLSNHAGLRVFQVIADAREQGAPLGEEGQAVWPRVQALLEQSSLEVSTPAARRPRVPQGRL